MSERVDLKAGMHNKATKASNTGVKPPSASVNQEAIRDAVAANQKPLGPREA